MLKYKTSKLKIMFKFWHWATENWVGHWQEIKSLGGKKNCDYFLLPGWENFLLIENERNDNIGENLEKWVEKAYNSKILK